MGEGEKEVQMKKNQNMVARLALTECHSTFVFIFGLRQTEMSPRVHIVRQNRIVKLEAKIQN